MVQSFSAGILRRKAWHASQKRKVAIKRSNKKGILLPSHYLGISVQKENRRRPCFLLMLSGGEGGQNVWIKFFYLKGISFCLFKPSFSSTSAHQMPFRQHLDNFYKMFLARQAQKCQIKNIFCSRVQHFLYNRKIYFLYAQDKSFKYIISLTIKPLYRILSSALRNIS